MANTYIKKSKYVLVLTELYVIIFSASGGTDPIDAHVTLYTTVQHAKSCISNFENCTSLLFYVRKLETVDINENGRDIVRRARRVDRCSSLPASAEFIASRPIQRNNVKK